MLLNSMLNLAERGRLPDAMIRFGIRRLCATRLTEVRGADTDAFADLMRGGPIAPVPDLANEQHYEVPAEFFEIALGQHRKYSSCYWPEGVSTLDEAEAAALAQTCERADLRDGQDVLELGCGWGSLTLWMAAHYPSSRITAVSNSHSQRAFIESQLARRGLDNVRIVTADMNDFDTASRFDRIVSVEMFEHMRNWERLLAHAARWLRPDGAMFVHVFCHTDRAYEFLPDGAANWMGRHFFSGGIMPSADLIDRFGECMTVGERWLWDGTQYAKTAEAWLANLDTNRRRVREIFVDTYGENEADRWIGRWRIFFMACAELFAYENGKQWRVAHYRLHPTAQPAPKAEAPAASFV